MHSQKVPGTFEDDVPFSKMEYGSSPEGNWLITLSSTTRRRATPFIGGYGSVPIQQHLLDDYIFHGVDSAKSIEAIFDYPDWGAGGYRDV